MPRAGLVARGGGVTFSQGEPSGRESVLRAVAAIREGRTIVVVDDESRENEGDLVCAAAHATPNVVNFMVRHGRGLLCVPMGRERLEALGLPPMAKRNTDPMGTAFTVSVDARKGVTTGISASERSATVMTLADPNSGPDDFCQPGHIFPLLARDGGVLSRAGHTEATIDLCRLAGLPPVGLICEILRDDGEMMRLPDLVAFAKEHDLPLLTIADLIEHQVQTHSTVRLLQVVATPGLEGHRAFLFDAPATGDTPVAWVWGEPDAERACLVRVHAQRHTDNETHEEHAAALQAAADQIAAAGEGVLVYLNARPKGGPNPGLRDSEEGGRAAMFRGYGLGAQILRACGVGRMRLITNRPVNPVALEGFGLVIDETLPLAAAGTAGEAVWDALSAAKGRPGA